MTFGFLWPGLFRERKTAEEQFVSRFIAADPVDRQKIASEFVDGLLDRIADKDDREVVVARVEAALRKGSVRSEIRLKKKEDIVRRLLRAFDPGGGR